MLEEDLRTIIRAVQRHQCEMQHIELKKAALGAPRVFDTLSAFANQQDGGILLFGIDESDSYSVCGVYDAQDLQVQISNQAAQMTPLIRPVFTVAEIDGKTVVAAEIAECDPYEKPCYYAGAGKIKGSRIRVGESDMPMTDAEIYSYEAFRRKIRDEWRIVERAHVGDLETTALQEWLLRLRRERPNLSRMSDERIMSLQGILEGGRPTLAGMLLFGEYPQGFLPQLCVVAVCVAGTFIGEPGHAGERFVDNRRIEGTLPQILDECMQFVRRNSRNATIIDDDGRRSDRTEYPMRAVRELVLNALMHRDYSIHSEHTPIRLSLFRDRLEIENPGGLYGITLDRLGQTVADIRNPFLGNALEILARAENRYSGIPTVQYEMREAALPAPLFESLRGVFKATLWNCDSVGTQVKEPTSGYLVENEAVPLPCGFACFGYERKDSTSRTNGNATSTDSHLKPAVVLPTTEQILAFCNEPKSRQELASHFGFSPPYYFVEKYVLPLVESGLLVMNASTRHAKKLRFQAK